MVPDRQGKGRGEVVGSADTVQNGEGEAKEKNTATEGVTGTYICIYMYNICTTYAVYYMYTLFYMLQVFLERV